MAIATLDGLLAGMQPARPFAKSVSPALVAGRPHSMWYLAGAPGAGSMDNSTSGGAVVSSTSAIPNGALPHVNPGAGNSYLARLQGMATQAGTLMLCDRLWHGSALVSAAVVSVTVTTSQTLTAFPTLPSRDVAGSANGDGVLIGMEVYAAMGAGAGNAPTLTYTNQAGTTAHTAALIDPYVASSAIGAFYRFGLQAGDTGVRAITAFQNSATMTSGNVGFVAYRVLATLELVSPFIPNAIDALTAGFPRLYDGVVPFFIFVPNTTTATNISGSYVESQG